MYANLSRFDLHVPILANIKTTVLANMKTKFLANIKTMNNIYFFKSLFTY